MSTIDRAIQIWPETAPDDWKIIGGAAVHKDAKIKVPAKNLRGGYIRSGEVSGDAWVSDNARVYGNACVYGNAWVSVNAEVSGDACVYGDAEVSGNARVSSNARVLWISHIGSNPIGTLTAFVDKDENICVTRGCFCGTIDEFEAAVQATHGDSQIAQEYKLAIALIRLRFGNKENMP